MHTLTKQQKKRFHAQYAYVGVEELPLAMLTILAFTHEQWNDTYLNDDRCARLYIHISIAETHVSDFTGDMGKLLAFYGDAVRETSMYGIARAIQYTTAHCEEEDTEREHEVKDEWADIEDDNEGEAEVVDAEYPEADTDDDEQDVAVTATHTKSQPCTATGCATEEVRNCTSDGGMLARAEVQEVELVRKLELVKAMHTWFAAYFNTVLTTGGEETSIFKDAYYGKHALLKATARRVTYKHVTCIVVEQHGTVAFIQAFVDGVVKTLVKLGYTWAFGDTSNTICINIHA
jgi:hypothetical protein